MNTEPVMVSAADVIRTFGHGGTAVHAQTATALEARVDRLEREMRAVQRKIFPGGAGATFEPEITAEPGADPGALPASSPMADLTQRVAALESQVQTLTGQVEQNQHELVSVFVESLQRLFAVLRRDDVEADALEAQPGDVAQHRLVVDPEY